MKMPTHAARVSQNNSAKLLAAKPLKPAWGAPALALMAALLTIWALSATPALAATRTWDGGGSTNNWSEAANWSGDTVPGPSDDVVFDGTSSKAATVDASFGGRVNSLSINSGYTGTITLGRNLWIVGSFTQTAGTFDVSASNHTLRAATLNQTAGTFTPRSGTVVLHSAANVSVTAASTLNSLRIEDPTETGLTHYWKFDQDSGTTAYDSVGSGNGALTNGPSFSSTLPIANSNTRLHNTNSLSLDGVDDFVDFGDLNTMDVGTGVYTLATWVKTSASGSGQSILLKDNWAGVDNGYFLYETGGQYVYWTTSGISIGAADGNWHHITIVRENTTSGGLKIYYDGVLIAGTRTDNRNITNARPFRVGATADSLKPLNGQVDDVRFYNRALLPAEVSRLADGRYASGTSGTATFTAGANLNVSQLGLDSGSYNSGAFTTFTSQVVSLGASHGAYTGGSATQTLNGGLTLNGGTFTAGSGTLDVNSDLTLSSGAFTASSGQTQVSGHFTRSGGTFAHNNGTMVFDGISSNLALSVATTFNNLTVSGVSTLTETNASQNATVSGTLTNSGTIRKSQAITGVGAKNFGLTGVDVVVSAQGSLTNVQVDRKDSNHPDATSGLQTGKYWTVTPTGAGFTLDMTLPHSVAPDSGAEVCRHVGSGVWDCARASSTSTTVTRSGITTLSDWAVNNNNATPTPTNTPEQLATDTPEPPTPTPTNTPIQQQATATPTPTNTPEPTATATPAAVAGSAMGWVGAAALSLAFLGLYLALAVRRPDAGDGRGA